MNTSNSIKDILYFDIPKCVSIYSQIDQGIITQSIATDDSGSSINSSIGVNLKFIEAKIGGDNSRKEGQSVTRIPHHDLLNRFITVRLNFPGYRFYWFISNLSIFIDSFLKQP